MAGKNNPHIFQLRLTVSSQEAKVDEKATSTLFGHVCGTS
jgi:hypothetical protein